jgi:hypothetical protein
MSAKAAPPFHEEEPTSGRRKRSGKTISFLRHAVLRREKR